MKGMLIKDIRFLLNQKVSLFIFLGLGLYFMIPAEEVSLSMAYITMMIAIFTTSSISYDGYDNGMAFLMTLPVQRRTYAISKYVFSLIVVLVMGLVISVMAWGLNWLQISHLDLSGLPEGLWMSVQFAMVATAFMVPVYLKFGGEKARYALVVIIGIVIAAGYFLNAVAGNWLVAVTNLLSRMADLPAALFFGGSMLGTIVIVLVSVLISIHVMEKKEY